MELKLRKLAEEAGAALAAAETLEELNGIRIRFLGKKGEVTQVLRGMASLSAEERPRIGQIANEVRATIEKELAARTALLKNRLKEKKLREEGIDVTLPGTPVPGGGKHPLSLVLEEIEDIFLGLGYSIAEGPEVETDYYNFEALNVPSDHPARDTQDTFYLTEKFLLRTQTSAAQIRTMEKRKPPIRIISPGRVYRADEVDATHSPVFHQVEGLVVDKGITMCDLKGVLEQFAHEIYGPETKVRFRPSFFPFTEPSVEVDVTCGECGGKGCRVCKGAGWIEILGAGMVHPNVLSVCGIDPEIYTGFAFGIGLDRLTTTRHKISDIRLLFENDLRFLEQFSR
mgnify:CR=1 FL=1